MAAEARRSASPDVEITAAMAQFGAQFIETPVEATIASHALLDILAAEADGYDAAIVSAFRDLGLATAKRMLDIRVVGLSEAALHAAYTLRRRIVIICLTPRHRDWCGESAEAAGHRDCIINLRVLPVAVQDISTVVGDLADPPCEECKRAVEEDRAEVVILGGGPTAGLAQKVSDQVPVPLLDGVSCAVQMAKSLAHLPIEPPHRGGFSRSDPKPTKELSPALATYFEG